MHDFNDKATAPLWEYQGVACRGRSRRANDAFVFYTWGHLPALIFRGYGGTIPVIVWFFASGSSCSAGFWFLRRRMTWRSPREPVVAAHPGDGCRGGPAC